MVDNFLEKYKNIYKNKYKNINSSPDKLKASPGRQGAKGIPMFWKNRQNSLMFLLVTPDNSYNIFQFYLYYGNLLKC